MTDLVKRGCERAGRSPLDWSAARFARWRHRGRHAVIAVTLLPFGTGCYRYAPVKMTDVSPGMDVRARVSAEASARIAPLLGVTSARTLTGTLITSVPDTIMVEVPATGVPDPGTVGPALSQRISIPRSDLVELEVRSLNRARTAAIVGGSAVVLVSLLLNVMKGDPAMEKTPGGGGSESIGPVFQRSR
ncbi:MAG: hypothetical protein MNPFHGCM_02651 [Gemmatimonadaceae bacterium]|nr:hypothetical protein [Gemmatimonadaceae bacterium]